MVKVHKGICTATCSTFKGDPYLGNGCPIVELRIRGLPVLFVSGRCLLVTPGDFLSRSRLELAVSKSSCSGKEKVTDL